MRPIIIAFALLLSLTACTRTIYEAVPVPHIVRDSTTTATATADTVAVVIEREVYRAGDTVRITEFRNRWHTKTRTDTVIRVRTDTITQVVTVPAAPAKSSRWLMIFYIAVAAAVAILIARLR